MFEFFVQVVFFDFLFFQEFRLLRFCFIFVSTVLQYYTGIDKLTRNKRSFCVASYVASSVASSVASVEISVSLFLIISNRTKPNLSSTKIYRYNK